MPLVLCVHVNEGFLLLIGRGVNLVGQLEGFLVGFPVPGFI